METCPNNNEVYMNVKKSLRIALAQHDKTPGWLAKKVGVSRQAISKFGATGHSNTRTIEVFCDALGMKASEFIALSEE